MFERSLKVLTFFKPSICCVCTWLVGFVCYTLKVQMVVPHSKYVQILGLNSFDQERCRAGKSVLATSVVLAVLEILSKYHLHAWNPNLKALQGSARTWIEQQCSQYEELNAFRLDIPGTCCSLTPLSLRSFLTTGDTTAVPSTSSQVNIFYWTLYARSVLLLSQSPFSILHMKFTGHCLQADHWALDAAAWPFQFNASTSSPESFDEPDSSTTTSPTHKTFGNRRYLNIFYLL